MGWGNYMCIIISSPHGYMSRLSERKSVFKKRMEESQGDVIWTDYCWEKIELLAYENDENSKYQKTSPKKIPMFEIQNSKPII